MGLFTELGRRVEEFKQTARDAADENGTNRCPACGEQFEGDHERCPECGEGAIESTGTEE